MSADYQDIMIDCERLFVYLAQQLRPNEALTAFRYQDQLFDITAPWPKFSVAELFEKYVSVDKEVLTSDGLVEAAQQRQLQAANWDDAFNLLFMNVIEPELRRLPTPLFVYDYPVQQAALAKRKVSDSRFAERFELYFQGIELGNAFSELTNATEQQQRFESELALRDQLGKTKYDLDYDFIEALKTGMPESGGIAVGVDRLVMLMADVPSIKDTLLFPIEEVFSL
jgi:elongation factor P--beta-lysine ligase